ncbi:hypothetical protein BT69DRAFT_1291640 [Atractiella rhizophila]|nr:hypothetical protein BT69DRAFT_1291640 [Atractiella rhizophila]
MEKRKYSINKTQKGAQELEKGLGSVSMMKKKASKEQIDERVECSCILEIRKTPVVTIPGLFLAWLRGVIEKLDRKGGGGYRLLSKPCKSTSSQTIGLRGNWQKEREDVGQILESVPPSGSGPVEGSSEAPAGNDWGGGYRLLSKPCKSNGLGTTSPRQRAQSETPTGRTDIDIMAKDPSIISQRTTQAKQAHAASPALESIEGVPMSTSTDGESSFKLNEGRKKLQQDNRCDSLNYHLVLPPHPQLRIERYMKTKETAGMRI